MRGWPWQRLAPVEEDDGGGLPGPVHGHLRPQAGSRARCPDAGWLGLVAGGRERSVRPHRLQRWWFICPLQHQDGGPPRRVAKLYLPPGERYFGSRAGYGLTYTSCQESGQFRSMFRQLAAEMGMDEKAVRAALSDG